MSRNNFTDKLGAFQVGLQIETKYVACNKMEKWTKWQFNNGNEMGVGQAIWLQT